ncbi:hypothetical protein VTK56DRAFT_785 [Thermocarpiscus australiensis]
MPSRRTTQHHCPQCFAIAKPRCFERGHMVRCSVHGVYHSPYSECVRCEAAARRSEAAARKEGSSGDGKRGKDSKQSTVDGNEAGPERPEAKMDSEKKRKKNKHKA